MLHRMLLLVTVATLLFSGCAQSDEEAKNAETDSIVQAWIDAWMDKEPDGVANLYAGDGTYADSGFPFEIHGRSNIYTMVANHMMTTTYTTGDALNVTYTDTGAVVDWMWGGTYKDEPFSMNPSTTFEIEDGLITKSTDAYDRSDAPW